MKPPSPHNKEEWRPTARSRVVGIARVVRRETDGVWFEVDQILEVKVRFLSRLPSFGRTERQLERWLFRIELMDVQSFILVVDSLVMGILVIDVSRCAAVHTERW